MTPDPLAKDLEFFQIILSAGIEPETSSTSVQYPTTHAYSTLRLNELLLPI